MKSVNSSIAEQLLATAWTYFDHKDSLIYSWHGEVFLNGYPLFDEEHDGRGNIDCSSFVHLVLQGIAYEQSPYATGNTEDFFNSGCSWASEELRSLMRTRPSIRKSNELARYYVEKKLSFSPDTAPLPGDLVFFQAPESSRAKYFEKGAFMAISHVGIVAEDPRYMIHSTGTRNKDRDLLEGKAALRYSPIRGRREPLLYARPECLL